MADGLGGALGLARLRMEDQAGIASRDCLQAEGMLSMPADIATIPETMAQGVSRSPKPFTVVQNASCLLWRWDAADRIFGVDF